MNHLHQCALAISLSTCALIMSSAALWIHINIIRSIRFSTWQTEKVFVRP